MLPHPGMNRSPRMAERCYGDYPVEGLQTGNMAGMQGIAARGAVHEAA